LVVYRHREKESKLDVARMCRVMAALLDIGVKKRHAVLSNYEAWQLWLERDVVKCICFSFSICKFAATFSNYTSSKSHYRPTVGQSLQIFAPQNVGIQIGPPLICVTKLHHIPTSWQRSRGTAFFFGLED